MTPARLPVAALHAPSLAIVRPADHVTVCRLLSNPHSDLARWRTRLCCRLPALVAELVPGGIDKEVVVNQAPSLLESVDPGDRRRPLYNFEAVSPLTAGRSVL